jgi:nitrogen fixation protein FixH
MRKIIGLLSGGLLVLLCLASCKKEVRALNTELSAVSSLSAPSDQAMIKLDPKNGASIVFRWDASKATDNGVILYEVVFDKESGDFSKPVYKTLSDGSGTLAQATVTQKDLNKIAALAGIQASALGKVKWTVVASKATNAKMGAAARTLQLERPAGFAELPATLFLTGTATEAGDDITKAIPLKKIDDGVFELYTSLKPGSYLLTDKASAGGTTYFIDANGSIKQGNTATVVADAEKPYRLNFDFNTATSQKTKIESVGLYMSAYNTEIGTLNYIGNSTWEAANIPVEFYQFSWGRDERYKFIVHTATSTEYMGSKNANNVSPAGQPADYFYLLPVTNSQWDNTYKFHPSADKKSVKVDVYFKADGPYTHQVTVL